MATGIGYQQKVVEIRDGHILWSDSLRIPISPMLGVVGVAQEHTRWTNAWAGEWGGNFDIQEVTTGASVHLPVSVPGALLPHRRHARAAGRRRDMRRRRHRGRRPRQDKVRSYSPSPTR